MSLREGRPRAAGSTSWIIGAQIRKLHESPIQESCPTTVHGAAVKLFSAGQEAFVSTDMPLATLSLGKYFRYQKIQFCQFPATQRGCEHFRGNDTEGGPGGSKADEQTNKQTGTILISPPRDIPLPSSLGDCHAQVGCVHHCAIEKTVPQSSKHSVHQYKKYERGTRHTSTRVPEKSN